MKKIIALFLTAVMCFLITTFVCAVEDEAYAAANELYELGLFKGTDTDSEGKPVFDLERPPTRHEAITMLVRLLGKEKEALEMEWDIPFVDVAEWAKPYVGYAYENGLTSGISTTHFGGENTVSASQYLTFVLRALGYKSGVDFSWDKAWELTDKLGLTDGQYNAESGIFVRGDIALISRDVLEQPVKDTDLTLAECIHSETKNSGNNKHNNHKTDDNKPGNNKPTDDNPGNNHLPAAVISEPDPSVSINTSCGNYNLYTPSSDTFTFTVSYNGKKVEKITRVSVTDSHVCSARFSDDGVVTVTRNGDGVAYIQVYYTVSDDNAPVAQPVYEMRTDQSVRFGPVPNEPGLSLYWRGYIIKNGSGFGLSGVNQTIFVPTVLLNGQKISEYTVSGSASGMKVTVQSDGSLLIEKPNAGSSSFTVRYGDYSATFSVNS